ncbi:kinesin family protein [Microdochium bolleyi]|uniref:Kinesin family protein n=1 Tax=Microdochium bolleyi TaxID=196109 RepID=A0A136J1R0_9PEZI|nr:kinesin family protein [Microdochium bolleyi]
MPPAGGGNIKVVVRCRPFNSREIERGAKCIVEMKNNQTVLSTPPDAAGKGAKDAGPKAFAFDRSYWSFDKSDPSYAGQDNLHDDLGKPLLENAFGGYNNCIFAYGQTGSGKSYSMMGYGKEHGIIPKICQDMFKEIAKLEQDKTTKCTVEVSYLEIYNERVRDLLNPSTKGNLKVREHPATGPYVEDLAKLVVSSFQEIENLMDEGNKARTVAATNMNETSSRSHAVFTLMLTQKKMDLETKMEMEKQAKISLVDLAGSERANSTGATGARLKEGAEINRSLSTLGRVIAALADLSTGKKKKGGATGQVPYRDSVLTWLLKDSLGGNSMTAMIAAISPADINYDETLSTLRYADSAKRIKNHAVVNEDANARMIRELKEELALLRGKLGGGPVGPGGVAVPPEEVYAEGTPLEKQIVSITQADGSVKKVSKAEIAEQLSQSEKLLTDLNQTWEEKLLKTEEIHKEREAALEELGISIEKGFIGLSTPKKMPHLVNLSDDPLLAECLVYNLKPGKTTVGNVESNSEQTANIRLNGSRILHNHCSFENSADGTVMVVPNEDASVMVNGRRTSEPTRLHSGYRVILGDFHIFRFNHPMEAKAERDEQRQSLLRQSLTASQIQGLMSEASTPTRPGHERSISKAGSDFGDSRPDSPMPGRIGRDSDWSLARREAAGAILGTDKNLQSLTDEELNALFEDVQRARAERVNDRDGDDDADSNTSYPIREKYLSTGTIDNMSLDTALTMPSTPKTAEMDFRDSREIAQQQLEKQKEEFQEHLKNAEAATIEVEEIKKEKAKIEETLTQMKAELQTQLEEQKKQYEAKIERMDPFKRPKAKPKVTEEDIARARRAVEHWRNRHSVKMAEAVLQHAATVKEAQIMSQELDEAVFFQFAVIDQGHGRCSSYDMVLNDVVSEGEDVALDEARKPCIGIRVIDYKNSVIRLWSLDKLHDRVRQMRQMHQYLDQPEYSQHFKLDNPFIETCMPAYSLIGEVDVPLKAVFESRVQDFTLEVLSPHTYQAIGLIKLSLEPSTARAPSSTLKYNVVMHELIGFPEREGTDVHAQLYIPGISEDSVTTTQMIRDFDEGPVRFDSVHSMSVPLFGPEDVTLRVGIFAHISSMHLDKLLSWDEMRDAPVNSGKPSGPRINETQFYTAEKHDLLSRVQILELDENGEYVAVEVTQTNELDAGTFQLHQGLQRRIAVNMTHSSGDSLPWDDISSMKVGNIQLVDHAGKTPDMAPSAPAIPLRLSAKPSFRQNANGTRSITISGQWDSSLHGSLLLDRVTAEKYKVQMTLSWEITSEKLAEPMRFQTKFCCQILGRSYIRQQSMLSSLWQHVRIVHSSSAVYTLSLRPAPIKRAGDLWRMNSQHDYVKGEENLTGWSPRGVSVVSDFLAARKTKRRVAEIGAAQLFLKKVGMPPTKSKAEPEAETETEEPTEATRPRDDDADSIDALLEDERSTVQPLSPQEGELEAGGLDSAATEENSVETTNEADKPEYDEHQIAVLNKCIKLWVRHPDPVPQILSPANTAPPADGIAPEDTEPPRLIATILRVPKNPKVLKGGYLLVPSNDQSKWVKRFVEVRRPYMHIHNATDGDEVAIVSLRNSRVDSQPEILAMFHGNGHNHHDDDQASVQGSDIHNNNDDASSVAGSTNGSVSNQHHPGHRRTDSGRLISSIWGGSNNTGPGLAGLNERLQAGVFAIYGTDNTWLFAARNERDKLDWIFRIDQSYFSGSPSANGSGAVSPQPSRGHAFGHE